MTIATMSMAMPSPIAVSTPMHVNELSYSQSTAASSPSTSSPLSVRVLRFFPEVKKPTASLKKTRFVYEIETCHQATGEVFRAQRRFREFKRLREGLLMDCRRHCAHHCAQCVGFEARLQNTRLPARQLVVLHPQRYGETRARELTDFLAALVDSVANHARLCGTNGPEVDQCVGRFLGVASLRLAEEEAAANAQTLLCRRKTRQERMEFRASSMPDFRHSSVSASSSSSSATWGVSEDMLETYRTRGFSAVELRQFVKEPFCEDDSDDEEDEEDEEVQLP